MVPLCKIEGGRQGFAGGVWPAGCWLPLCSALATIALPLSLRQSVRSAVQHERQLSSCSLQRAGGRGASEANASSGSRRRSACSCAAAFAADGGALSSKPQPRLAAHKQDREQGWRQRQPCRPCGGHKGGGRRSDARASMAACGSGGPAAVAAAAAAPLTSRAAPSCRAGYSRAACWPSSPPRPAVLAATTGLAA